jgi:uncharacterized membrane protein HdeD (DUF308 family)
MALKLISNLLLALFVLVLGIAEILAAAGQNLAQYTGWAVGVLGILAGLTLLMTFTSKKK